MIKEAFVGTYRVINGTVMLYASRLNEEKKHGRFHHFKTVRKGETFFDYAPVKKQAATWVCIAKRIGGAECVSEDSNCADTEEFNRFIGTLEEELEENAGQFRHKNKYADQVLEKAVKKLASVNTRISGRQLDQFKDEDEHVEVCKVLCGFLKAEPKIPAKDIAGNLGNPAEEILHLSGIRYKKVSLHEHWWKHNNGAMLGSLEDDTPIALMPGAVSGYRAYDPKTRKLYKVNAAKAAKIKTRATAVFRTFPARKIALHDIAGFLLGERLYKEITVITLCSLLANIIAIIPPVVAAQIFDVIVPENLRVLMIEVVFILIAFELANVGVLIMSNLGISRINTKCGLIMRAALWDRLLSLRIPFFNNYTTGELLQKIKSIDQIKHLISMENLQTIFSNLFAFVYIIALYNFNSSITVYVLLMFLIQFAVYFIAGRRKYEFFKIYTDLESKSSSFSHQCVRGIQRVKSSCAEERVFNIWSAYEADKRSAKSKIGTIDNALSSFQLFFDFASTAVIYLLISRLPDVGMGVFVAYIATFLIFQKSMRKLFKALGVLPELISIYTNIKPILDAEPEYSAKKLIPAEMSGTLEINHGTFRFSQYGHTIFSDISFRVEEGESAGIIGLSGGGKTTLQKALMGFYSLTGGKIYYGGYDLETLDMRYLRKKMGVVLQQGKFNIGSIYNNITDNDRSVDHAAVMDAIRMVGFEDKVNSLPDGLYTNLEDCPLSDGERQRLLIARAIVKKHTFLFLDEATSSLDNISQSMILKNMNSISATKIIIAQRLETVRYCDKIIVIGNGKIVMQGPYNQIIREHAQFRKTAAHEKA